MQRKQLIDFIKVNSMTWSRPQNGVYDFESEELITNKNIIELDQKLIKEEEEVKVSLELDAHCHVKERVLLTATPALSDTRHLVTISLDRRRKVFSLESAQDPQDLLDPRHVWQVLNTSLNTRKAPSTTLQLKAQNVLKFGKVLFKVLRLQSPKSICNVDHRPVALTLH